MGNANRILVASLAAAGGLNACGTEPDIVIPPADETIAGYPVTWGPQAHDKHHFVAVIDECEARLRVSFPRGVHVVYMLDTDEICQASRKGLPDVTGCIYEKENVAFVQAEEWIGWTATCHELFHGLIGDDAHHDNRWNDIDKLQSLWLSNNCQDTDHDGIYDLCQ